MKIKIIISTLVTSVSIYAQVPTGSPPTPYPAFSAPEVRNVANFAWYRGGNTPIGPAGGNNIFGTATGFNSNIWHQTNGFTRMLMEKGASTQIDGRIAYGNNLPGTFSPQARLHLLQVTGANPNGNFLRSDGLNTVENLWEMYTGNAGSVTQKFKLFIPIGPGTTNLNTGLQATTGEMFFNTTTTNGTAPGSVAERMRLSYGTGGNLAGGFNTPGVTKILLSHDGFGVNYLPPAVAMLNLGSSTPNPSAGSRPWMDIGTYYSMHTDNMYVGLKDEGGANRVSSVINWGDDPAGTNSNNRLLYLFTGFGGQGESSTPDGLEVGRMWASANAGRMGIGGDPTINRYFGNSFDPNNTLEVNSPANFTPNTVGASGLRFTDLRSTSTPQLNPGTGVLSVDANGDVVLVPGGSTAANNGIFINATTGAVQLGGTCGNLTEVIASALTTDRRLFLNNKNIWFADNTIGGVGIGDAGAACGTSNTFEVSANSKNAQYGSTNASGMRFTKLTSASPAIPNGTNGVNNTKVLTVDGDGDVVLTDATGGSGAGLGNLCSAPVPNPLTGHYEIPLATHNFYYSGQQDFTSNVGIGIPCSQGIYAKLHVIQYKNNLNSIYNNNYASVTGRFDNYASNNTTDAYGVIGSATSTGSVFNIGVYGIANGSPGANYGVVSQGDLYTTGGANTAGGYVSGSDKNIKTDVAGMNSNLDIIRKLKPVSFRFDNSYAPQLTLNTHKNYGFIAQEIETVLPDIVTTSTVLATYDSTGNMINPPKSLKSLNYDGLIPFAIGGIQELQVKQLQMQEQIDKAGLSDAQVKTNINSFNALAKVKTLSPVSYNFTNANVPQLTFKPNLEYGFVAQQLETVYPELVDTVNVPASYDSLGNVVNAGKTLKSVNYKAMTALLARSIQEQQLTIDSLRTSLSKQDSVNQAVQQQLTNLTNLINSCCSNNSRTSVNSIQNQLDVELNDKDAIVLNQNVPNPFAEQTTITYNVPQSVSKAQLLFYNSAGQIIQTVDIKTRGKGKTNVFASDLSSGLYHYTLVADGKVVDSKKMVRE